MPDIFLLIPDASLREAVTEQILAAKLGEPRPIDAPQTLPQVTEGKNEHVVIIDERPSKDETESLLCALNDRTPKPVILMLGATDDLDVATETFIKPLRLGHLMSRLRYYLETAPKLRERVVFFGSYRLEPQNRRAFRQDDAEPIRLTEKETALLVFLAHCGKPATRQDILSSVWGYDNSIDTHTLETHIYQLRRKLDASGTNWLISEEGTYRLAGKEI